MKLIGIRLPDDLCERLEKIAKNKELFKSKNEAYQKICALGISLLEQKNSKNIDEANEVSCAISIENRHYMRQIYRLLFDASKSKFTTPDDEIEAAKSSAKETATKLVNGDLKWTG